MSKTLKATFGSPDSPLVINGIEIPCYVLEDGKRVITQTGLLKALGVQRGSLPTEKYKEFGAGARLVSLLDQIATKPLETNNIKAVLKNPIVFSFKQTKHYGYDALILQEITRAISKAYLKATLSERQKHIGVSAEILDDAFSKIGIIALIDEVTGYQKVRGKQDLQKFLDKFLLQEHAKWIKTYADEFFETIYKMKGWDWNIVNKGKNPSVMGHYINNFVYARVAPQILTELKKLNPMQADKGHRQFKHTQFIDKDFGHPKLKEHIASIIALGKASGYNWRNFQRLVNRALPKYGHSFELNFPDEIID